ncbi:potassium channel family protein [Candidatus Enterovibrio altilux]|uniref:Potassium channel protein n=1 Tax=Candidatus Enterovibrio altilux TaxID=1927128 RepID=A0A291B6Z2_9GAMM|nr:potassium channel family protein [Candidatus Enterovibrio luxaltus]ATF08755.1 Putative potassium channel protein [Candidatus Enterovibrio luxaltus]
MYFWLLMRRWLFTQFSYLSGRNILFAWIVYSVICWLMLRIVGEQALTLNITDFIYYLLVTTSTVGYGDMYPQTVAGKWIVVLFVIPAGLSLFGLTIGRLAAMTMQLWKSSIMGKRRVNVSGHILILGWNGQRTLYLIQMLLHEEKKRRRILLCIRPEMENPLPEDIDFVQLASFTDTVGMERAGVAEADCIIIDNEQDDITLSAALFCSNKNPNAHILAYFNEAVLCDLLKQHCPNVECIPSLSVAMLAKEAVDPGSSELHHELLHSQKGMTQYSVKYPPESPTLTVKDLFIYFKNIHDATLIGIDTGRGLALNPSFDTHIKEGTRLFYIADERVNKFQWPRSAA